MFLLHWIAEILHPKSHYIELINRVLSFPVTPTV